MKLEVEMELENVYGGDGETRSEPTKRLVQKKERTKTVIWESIEAEKRSTKTKVEEKGEQQIETFKFDEHGNPILRLGGSHGKLWGALKASGKQLYQLGDVDFKRAYKSTIDMIQITPVWVPLQTEDEFRVEVIPQILESGARKTMIFPHFDTILHAKVKVVLVFPDELKTKVNKLLAQLEVGSHFNKRRATVKVVNKREI